MPEPTKIPRAFAASGDKNSIPDSSGSPGFASWQEGFPAITSEPFAQGGIAPKRADFNGIFNALSLATLWQQQGGFYAYDNTTDYEVGNVVEYNNDLYKCLAANGPGSAVKAPTDATVWSKVMTAADAAALYFPLSGGAITGQVISRDVTDSALRLLGGTTNENGSYISIWGKDAVSAPGYIYAIARTSASVLSTLLLTPSGSFSWRGLEVPYCFTGSATNVSRGDFINFTVSPPKAPSRIYVFHPSSTPSSLVAYGLSKTGFYLGASTSPVDNVYYIAFCLGGGN